MKQKIKFTVNGEVREYEVAPNQTLLTFIREDMDLTGAKEGCAEGECGACTVLLDGKAVNACMMFAVEADGKEIETIEGLASGSGLSVIQETFIEYSALQCGYCTPGMIMSTEALLRRNPNPTDFEIREAIAGNLCRCTGYTKIIEAIKAVAEKIN
ncbi:(2Fe-2S)-binding protein [Selenihalanaerobacter shriftii]|uniref:Carbon-monoxide dehydrogenase small subunit n=1 Tax=Selenihalanaerobacter shriftii TaxID=142842 RepID=A0A1T4JT89_9FIRM|nr:(2Fe-2S)-binding protein [Selenihalanaerobacter shriftii]SJZ33368.1 carbon-monoxide dehydrogenase small subunit [Selenihalanaerobacter shriftii]